MFFDRAVVGNIPARHSDSGEVGLLGLRDVRSTRLSVGDNGLLLKIIFQFDFLPRLSN